MNIDVAIQATSGHCANIVVCRRTSGSLLHELAPMVGGIVDVMTALAQKRLTLLQKRWRSSAVRVVTNSTILGNRLMIVQEGATLFHVAFIASLVDAVLDQ
jgi:hypothetical protein